MNGNQKNEYEAEEMQYEAGRQRRLTEGDNEETNSPKTYALTKELINSVITGSIDLGHKVDIWSAVNKGNILMGQGAIYDSGESARRNFHEVIWNAGYIKS